ncbi:MAG TPA: endoribonuclease MazF [Opitutaceae bacterium]|nr:endoribonuclease MazF [Opitutaceae bacterium]
MSFVPDRGDLVWINFDPQAGHEQAGRRPALILSPKAYNQKSGLMLACPITRQAKGLRFEVMLDDDDTVSGVVLSDHLRSMDWKARRAERFGRISSKTLEQVHDRVGALLQFESS